jgi:cephalosporin hydroxylase
MTGQDWNEVFDANQTDKAAHRYGHVYQYLLESWRDRNLRLLEIGVWEGGSLRAWHELLPNAHLVGMDILQATAQYRKPWADIVVGDASKVADLGKLKPYAPFDVIIDDGSHQPNDVNAAYAYLWPLLNVGGVYVIEDLDVAHYPEYQRGVPIILDITDRLRAETHSIGVQDRITVMAGELAAFIKLR